MAEDTSSSGGGHGSKIRAETAASRRRANVPEHSRSYRYAGGGSVGVPTSRRAEAAQSKNERGKFAKELRTARVFAHAGYRIDFTPKGAGTHDVFINGVPADIKQLSSHNNIARHARHATKRQGAKMVLFEFTKRTAEIEGELMTLKSKGIHGKYFYRGENIIRDF